MSDPLGIITASIPNAGSITPAIDLGAFRAGRIHIPAAWTAAALTFQVSADGSTYGDLFDNTGVEYTAQAAAGRAVLLPLIDFLGMRYLKIRSGPTAAPVAQAAQRDLVIQLVP